MDNELRIRNFIINLDEPFSLAELIVAFRKNGGTNDIMALNVVTELLDNNQLFYQEVTIDDEGYPIKAYVTKKYIEKLKNPNYTR